MRYKRLCSACLASQARWFARLRFAHSSSDNFDFTTHSTDIECIYFNQIKKIESLSNGPPPFFYLFFFLCVCFFFRVVCVCVRLARQGPRRRARSARTSSTECAAMHKNSKQSGAKLCRILKKSTQIGEFSTQLSPNNLHNFKKTFRHYHATPPKQSVQILPTLSTWLSKMTFTILVPNSMCDLGTFVCESRRLSPQFPRLSQNTCVTASLARFKNSLFEAPWCYGHLVGPFVCIDSHTVSILRPTCFHITFLA